MIFNDMAHLEINMVLKLAIENSKVYQFDTCNSNIFSRSYLIMRTRRATIAVQSVYVSCSFNAPIIL